MSEFEPAKVSESKVSLGRIRKWAEKVAIYSHADPETALLHARRTSEAICREIYAREVDASTPVARISFDNLIKDLATQRLVPKEIRYSLDLIKNFGNMAAHAEEEEIQAAIPALNLFPTLLGWYLAKKGINEIPEELRFRPISAEDLVPLPSLSHAYCVFGYETENGRDSTLWQEPTDFQRQFSLDSDGFRTRFEEWLQSKRKFFPTEIVQRSWVKIGDNDHPFRLRFERDGKLREWSLFSFSEDEFWTGTWKLEDGVLKTHINGYEEVDGVRRIDPVGYDMDIVASRDGLHSAVENRGGSRNAYFRIFQIT